MRKPEEFDALVRHASMAADGAVIGKAFPTEAAKIRAAVERALRFVVTNELVTLKPEKEWPMWLALDPEEWNA